MSKNIPDTTTMTTEELSDKLFSVVYKMPTGKGALKRAAELCSASSLSVSEKPYACYGQTRCGMASCPLCRVHHQRLSIIDTLSFVSGRGGSCAWQAITITPEIGKVDVGELPTGGLRGFRNQVSARIRKIVPNAVAVMCVNIVWERKSGEQEQWQYGVKGIISTQEPEALDQLHARFAWKKKTAEDDGWVRPVIIAPISDFNGWLAEMSTPQFEMRIQRPDANGNLKAGMRKITIERELQFAKVLSNSKVTQRFFSIGK
jgi:hypothetical protein